MDKPLVSVLMSVYNGDKFLTESVDSILNQTYTNLEILIADDCSLDRSLEILLNYELLDSRIRIIKNEHNLGLTKTLNKLIELSSGKYIARMDGDDVSHLDRIEEEVKKAEETNADIVYSNCNIIDINSRFICTCYKPNNVEKVKKLMRDYNYIPHPTVLMKRQTLIDVGKYNEKYTKGQDRALWLKCIEMKKIFLYINKPLLDYRINPYSVRGERDSDYAYEVSKMALINGEKRIAIKNIFDIKTNKKKFNILIRLMVPFNMYRKIVIAKAKGRQKDV